MNNTQRNMVFMLCTCLYAPLFGMDGTFGDGSTELTRAAERGQTESVRQLIAAGAKINTQDNAGYTALHWAVKNRHYDTAELLLESGANPDIPQEQGCGPIHHAATNSDIDMVELLLRYHAYANAKIKKYNSSALNCAADHPCHPNYEKIINLLLAHGAKW